jgi:hypothetical protein
MDKTGVNTSTKRPPKILSTTEKKQMGIIDSAQLTTKCTTYNSNFLLQRSWFVCPTISQIGTKTPAGSPS